jgi:hypothetical protein
MVPPPPGVRFRCIAKSLKNGRLVPWRPALERHLGRQVVGSMSQVGRVDWNFGPKRGLGV